MDAVIVDTNVIVIANDTDDKREDCRDRCQDRLQQIRDQRETVILDDGWRIFEEYERYVKPNTRKGDGDLFVKRLLQNLGEPRNLHNGTYYTVQQETVMILPSFQTMMLR